MQVPINCFKFFGIEFDVYRHQRNPSEEALTQNLYLDEYLEIVITITKDNFFINPQEYRVLIVSPIDGRQLFVKEGNLFALTLAPFEQFVGLSHHVEHSFKADGAEGADLLDIFTKPIGAAERQETLVIRHNKGLVVPEHMLFN